MPTNLDVLGATPGQLAAGVAPSLEHELSSAGRVLPLRTPEGVLFGSLDNWSVLARVLSEPDGEFVPDLAELPGLAPTPTPQAADSKGPMLQARTVRRWVRTDPRWVRTAHMLPLIGGKNPSCTLERWAISAAMNRVSPMASTPCTAAGEPESPLLCRPAPVGRGALMWCSGRTETGTENDL